MAEDVEQFSTSIPSSGAERGNGRNIQFVRSNVGSGSGSGEPGSTTQSSGSFGISGSNRDQSATVTPQLPTSFDTEIARKQEELVTKYREGEITKADALYEVQKILQCEDNTTGGRYAFAEFVSTVESVDSLASAARRRGKKAAAGLANQNGSQPNFPDGETPDQATDQPFNDLIDEIGSQPKRTRPNDQGDEDSNAGGADDIEGTSGKKKIKLSELPWYVEEKVARDTARPSCQKTQDLLHIYQRDPAWIRRQLVISGVAPPSIPGSEWDAIIRGTAVNLDAVFSSLYHVLPPKEDVGHVGPTEIRFNNPEPAKKVKTAGDWATAFDEVIEATSVAFPHRRQEFKEYSSYIRSQFSAKQPTSHPRVIMLDVAIRNFVAGGQRYLLTDWNEFTRFHSAIIAPDGIEADRGSKSTSGGSGSGSRGRSATGKKGSRSELCDRFNSSTRTCPNTASTCRWLHNCKRCGVSGHGERDCVQDGRGSGSKA